MTPRYRRLTRLLCSLALLPCGAALAQQPGSPPAPVELPKPQDIDPAVDTSSPAAPGASVPAAASAAAPAVPSPRAPRSTVPGTARAAAATTGTKPGQKVLDRLELDSTQITGNRELPKVLYIVPWKRSDLGELIGRPQNSLLDEVLAPVDRDVFQRENRYYNALKPDSAQPPDGSSRGTETAAPAARGDEK